MDWALHSLCNPAVFRPSGQMFSICLLSWLINREDPASEASSLFCAYMRWLNMKCVTPFLVDDWVPQSAAKRFAACAYCTAPVSMPSSSWASTSIIHPHFAWQHIHVKSMNRNVLGYSESKDWPWMQEENTTEIYGEGKLRLSYLSFWLQLSIVKYAAASWGGRDAAGSQTPGCSFVLWNRT